MIVYLKNADIKNIKEVASSLSDYWKTKKKSTSAGQTFGGLKAECAAIKYFNYTLGAAPLIEFNTLYKDGGDGGFDFTCCNLRWDVKSVYGNSLLKTSHAKRTKADCIILVRRRDVHAFQIVGFCPITKLPNTEFITDSHFQDLKNIVRLFNWRFEGPKLLAHEQKFTKRMSSAAEVLIRNLKQIEKNYDAAYGG